jgi:hypothetical protein
MATPEMLRRAAEFERQNEKAERSLVRDRAKRVKAEGYKSEQEYFAKTNPFKNYETKHFTKSIPHALKAKSKALDNKKKVGKVIKGNTY